jgi:thioesterase domain-containing protein
MAMLRKLPPEDLRTAAKQTAAHFTSDDCDTSIDAIVAYLSDSALFAEGLRTELIRPYIDRLFGRTPLVKTSRLRRVSAPLIVWRASDGIGVGKDGWSEWTESNCEEAVLPGDHLTVMQKPAVEVLAAQLAELTNCFDAESPARMPAMYGN